MQESEPERPVALAAGDTQVVEPGVPHRVEPSPDARFVIELYR